MKPTLPHAVRRLAFALLALPAFAMAKPWKSAELITQQNFKYGAFEARIRGAEGSGMITAYFLYKNGSEWEGAEWQEQDFELFGKNGGFQTQVMTPGNPRTEHVVNHRVPTNVWERYYTYRMEWTPTALSFFVDGKLIRRETDAVTYAKILDPARAEPMNLRISLWAGDFAWSGAFDSTKVPSAVDVNWAQVYSYTPGTGPGGSDFSLLWRDDFDRIDNSKWFLANWTFDHAVNDYAPGGARTSNGYLQLKMTHWSEEGTRFTPSPLDDGLLMPPTDVEVPPPAELLVREHPERVYVLPDTIDATLPSKYADSGLSNSGAVACGPGPLDAFVSAEGGCHVGGIVPGEWEEYSISTLESANWNLALRVAAGSPGAKFRVLVDGQPLGGTIELPLGSWTSFQNLQLGAIPLSAGSHVLRIEHLTRGMSLKNLAFTRTGVTTLPESTLVTGPVHVPAAILAKNYARANDLTATNLGGKCRTGVVDLQVSTDLYRDCNVGWAQAGEWIEYDVHSLEAADYDLSLRISSALAGRTVQVSVNQVNLGAPVAAPGTGFSAYATLPAGRVALPAGTSKVRITFIEGSLNFHWLRLEKVAPVAVVPAIVQGLVATAGQGTISLTWSASSNTLRYVVERSVDGGLNFAEVRTQTGISWTDTQVEPGIAYTYRVVAKGATSDAAPSSTVSAVPEAIQPVGIPSGLTATPGDAQVSLAWSAVEGATGYVVNRGLVGGALTEIARPTANAYLDLTVVNGNGYSYTVVALQGDRSSEPSSPVVATPVGLPPAQVASVTATPGDETISLTWPAAARATSYGIQKAVGSESFATVATVTTTSWTDLGLVNGVSYSYRIVANNAEGFAPASPTVTSSPIEPPPVVASVRVDYQAGNTGSTNGIRPLLRVINTGTEPVSLSNLKIRYWFTRDGASSNSYWCDWAQVGSANVLGSFQNLAVAKTNADTYLEIGFRPAAGTLAPGASTGEIQSRFSKADWSNYNQSNDASYDATATSYRASTKVTAYLDGVLIWGEEP